MTKGNNKSLLAPPPPQKEREKERGALSFGDRKGSRGKGTGESRGEENWSKKEGGRGRLEEQKERNGGGGRSGAKENLRAN